MIKKWFPVLEHMNIPNAISLAGLSLSISSLYFLLAGNLKVACIMAYLGGILDGIDGAVAHKLNQQSALGAELDSLCDAISFNVVPLLFGALVVRRSPLMWICGLIYCLCGVLRLGYYNMTSEEVDGYFIGVPTTIATIFVVYAAWLCGTFPWIPRWLLAPFYLLMGGLMISKIRFKKTNGRRIAYGVLALALLITVIIF